MTDRVESAERLLATIAAGRAHVRTLAMLHLPPGRAISMELRAGGLLTGPPAPVVLPAAKPPSSEPAPSAAGSMVQPPAAAPEPGGTNASGEVPSLAEAPVPTALPSPAAAAPLDITAPEASPAHTTDSIVDALTDAETSGVFDLEDEDDPHPASGAAPDTEHSGSFEQTQLIDAEELVADQLDPLAGWEGDAEEEAATIEVNAVGDLSWASTGTDSPRDDSFDARLFAAMEGVDPVPLEEPDQERTQLATPNHQLLDAIRAADAAEAADEMEAADEEDAIEAADDEDAIEAADEEDAIEAADEEDAIEAADEEDAISAADDDSGFELDELDEDFALSADQLNWYDSRGEALPSSPDVLEADAPAVNSAPASVASDPGQAPAAAAPDAQSLSQAAPASSLGAISPGGPHVKDGADDARPSFGGTESLDVLEELDEDDPYSDSPEASDEPDLAPPRVSLTAPQPALSVPRVVEPRASDALVAPGGSAAIQILGDGRAQTLTPTLELGGEEDDADSSSSPLEASGTPDHSDGFSLQFEEPEEESAGPHIPTLTEEVESPHQPTSFGTDAAAERRASAKEFFASGAADEFIEHAHAAEQKGLLSDAVVHYGDLLSHDPQHLGGYLGRGRCYVDLGDYGSAMSDFTRAEDIAPDSPEPLVEMGNLFFARKEYKRAITYYNHALDLDNGHAMAFSRRGISFYHRKMYREAHDDLLEAQRRDPSIPGIKRYIQVTSRKLKK